MFSLASSPLCAFSFPVAHALCQYVCFWCVPLCCIHLRYPSLSMCVLLLLACRSPFVVVPPLCVFLLTPLYVYLPATPLPRAQTDIFPCAASLGGTLESLGKRGRSWEVWESLGGAGGESKCFCAGVPRTHAICIADVSLSAKAICTQSRKRCTNQITYVTFNGC